MQITSALFGGLAMLAGLVAPPALADDYPIVFESAQEARKIGFVIQGYGPGGETVRPERINCYDYGSATYILTMSKQVLRAFEQRSFTLQSLCFGLVSLARFDPESGQRMPTFIVIDRAAAIEDLNGNNGEIDDNTTVSRNFATPEIPLSLPGCYARGVPLLDCQWRFNPNTGEALPGDVAAQLGELGQQIDQVIKAKIDGGLIPTAAARPGAVIETHDNIHPVIDLNEGNWLQDVRRIVRPMQFDISEGFQQRYGYALKTDGSGGPPSVSAFVVKNALDHGKPASQLRLARIREVIGN